MCANSEGSGESWLILFLFTGFMILLGTIVFGTDSKAEAYDILINNEKIEDYKFQAGFYLSIAAGFLSVVTGIVFCAFRIDKQVPGQRQSHAASGPRTLDSIKHIFKERRSRLSNLICRQDITICLWFDNEWNKNSGDKLPIAS